MLLGRGHWWDDRVGEAALAMTVLWPSPTACGASLLPLHLSEDVAISARDQSLGLGAEGGEWITDVTLLFPVLAAWPGSEGFSCVMRSVPLCRTEGEEVVGFACSASKPVLSSVSFNSESVKGGSRSLAWDSSLNLSHGSSPGLMSLWSESKKNKKNNDFIKQN